MHHYIIRCTHLFVNMTCIMYAINQWTQFRVYFFYQYRSKQISVNLQKYKPPPPNTHTHTNTTNLIIRGCFNIQVSVTLIATGFRRQDETEGRSLQVTRCSNFWTIYSLCAASTFLISDMSAWYGVMKGAQLGQGANLGTNRRTTSSFTEGSMVDIPEFLRKKGRPRFPRAW